MIWLCQVVFRSGQGALQVLPPLVDVIPEARLNLVIYHLRQGPQHLHCISLVLLATCLNFSQWCYCFRRFNRRFVMMLLHLFIINMHYLLSDHHLSVTVISRVCGMLEVKFTAFKVNWMLNLLKVPNKEQMAIILDISYASSDRTFHIISPH